MSPQESSELKVLLALPAVREQGEQRLYVFVEPVEEKWVWVCFVGVSKPIRVPCQNSPFSYKENSVCQFFLPSYFKGSNCPLKTQCQASTHGRDLGKLPAPPPWTNQIVLFIPTDEVCMSNFMCLLLNYLSISWVI